MTSSDGKNEDLVECRDDDKAERELPALVVRDVSDFFKHVESINLVDTDNEVDRKITARPTASTAHTAAHQGILLDLIDNSFGKRPARVTGSPKSLVACANGITRANGPGYEAIIVSANGPGYKAIVASANGPGYEAIIACELDRECRSANCMLGHICTCSYNHIRLGPVFSAAAFPVDRICRRMLSCR